MSGCSFVEKRSNRYYFRVRLPVDLVPVAGRSHVVASLFTSDPRAAKVRAARLYFSLASIFETMRLKMPQVFDIDPNDLSRSKILATEAFALGQEYGALQKNLQQEFSERLSKLIASLKFDSTPECHVTADVVKEDDGETTFLPISPRIRMQPGRAVVIPESPPARPPASPAWTSLKTAFLADKPGLTSKTLWSYRQAFNAWEGLIGDKAISSIKRTDLKMYADYLRDRPSGRDGRLDHKSIERSLGHIKNFMRWATAAGYVENDHFGDVKGRDKTQEELMALDSRRAFTAVELHKLFASRLFQKPTDGAEKAAAWFLAIAALSGARTEEIAQAPAQLVRRGETWCLDLRQSGTKTKAAPRLVPLLPDLVRLGLLQWAAGQAAAGRRLVQPDVKPRTSQAWSKYLNRYIDIHVTDAADLVLYSLRHSFRQMLRAANVGDELANKVFGHETGSVGAGYGKDLSFQEAELVVRLVRPPLDLGHLKAWS